MSPLAPGRGENLTSRFAISYSVYVCGHKTGNFFGRFYGFRGEKPFMPAMHSGKPFCKPTTNDCARRIHMQNRLLCLPFRENHLNFVHSLSAFDVRQKTRRWCLRHLIKPRPLSYWLQPISDSNTRKDSHFPYSYLKNGWTDLPQIKSISMID